MHLPITQRRFEVLDSWRGIAACVIVLLHLNGFSLGHLGSSTFVDGSFLFVDFFFVLSGFIITMNYRDKLISGAVSVKDFIFLRLGRIYPLHFFVLLCFLALDFIASFLAHKPPLSSEWKSPESLLANLFLVHDFNLFDTLTWNGVSWSIGAEFFTYIAFAMACLAFKARLSYVAGLILLAAPFILPNLSHANIDMTYDYGFLRCLYGFSGGVITYGIYQRLISKPHIVPFSERSGSWAEIAAVTAIVILTAFFAREKISFLAPFLFMAVVLVFSFESGIVSRILSRKPFLFLGMISYSIYMVHFLVLSVLYNVAEQVSKHTGLDLFSMTIHDGKLNKEFGTNAWQGDLFYIVAMIGSLAAATITYYIIEKPANGWFKRYLKDRRAPVAQARPDAEGELKTA